MTRGNQRELARAKNMKKQQEQAKKKAAADKGSNKGQGLEARKQRDADVMRQKQLKAEAKKSEQGAAGGK
ncbi:small EDRK-rich factor 2-like isoform X2 [Branchiostoma floridae x Branchiostoma japonicum]